MFPTSTGPACRPPTLPGDVIDALREACGTANVLTNPDDLVVYEADAYPVVRAVPPAVVFPNCTASASAAVGILARAGIPFVPRGAGTSLAGGCLSSRGAVCLCTARMRRILELDPDNACAVVEAGVVTQHVSEAAADSGLHYAPDPSSQTTCTIGGNVATGAGGPHTLKYGVTANHILGLTVVLPDGAVAHLGGRGRSTPGLDLTRLWVGSEGTLGLVTEIIVHLAPRPAAWRTVLAAFDDLDAASSAVGAIIASGVAPAALEMMDRAILQLLEQAYGYGFPTDAEAVLIIELEGLDAALDEPLDAVLALCKAHGVRYLEHARDPQQRALLWKARKSAFGALGRSAPHCITQDGVVPRSRLPQILEFIRDLGRRTGLSIANNFHAGDGNIHPNFLFNGRDPGQLERVLAASAAILDECVRLGGSVSGEHGIGVEKIQALQRMYAPADLQAQRAIHRALDPHDLANPGKVFAEVLSAQPQPPAAPPGVSAAEAPRPVEDPGWTLDGAAPQAVLAPHCQAQAAAALAACHAENVVVIPRGAGRCWHDLRPVSDPRPFVVLSMQHLDGLVAHAVEDLTITVQAGMTLQALLDHCAACGQYLPLWAPETQHCTIGGLLATHPVDPGRLQHGLLADHVLGGEMILADGTAIAAGARTVKSVAGYDLHRLVVGSRGALAVLVSVTFKLRPAPAVLAVALYPAAGLDDAFALARAVLCGPSRPLAIEVIPPATGAVLGTCGSGWAVLVACSGSARAVDWQMDQLSACCALERRDGTAAADLLRQVVDFCCASDMASFQIEGLRPHGRELLAYCCNQGLEAIADFGGRTVRGRCGPAAAAAHDAALQARAGIHGTVTWHGLPPGSRTCRAASDGAAQRCLRSIKQALDPRHILPAPGFLGCEAPR